MTALPQSSPPRSIRVLHVNAGNMYGGIETYLTTLARRRDLTPGMIPGFAVFFEGRLAEELRRLDVPVLLIGAAQLSRPWTVLRARRALDRILAGGEWDVVVTHGCWPHLMAGSVARRRRIPLVFCGHAIQEALNWVDRLARRTEPDLVIANSQATARSISSNLFPRVPAEVIHLPVAAPELPAETRREVRAEFDVPDQTVVGLTISRIEAGKGHAVLIQALADLTDVPDWRWWIVGGPQRESERDLYASLKHQAESAGLGHRIRFVGTRSDVRRLLSAADLYCQPNVSPESFGIVFVEALYAGLPVATSAIGGAVEIVDESCGILTPPEDVGALRASLARLMNDSDERRRLGAAGPKRARAISDPASRLAELERSFFRIMADVSAR